MLRYSGVPKEHPDVNDMTTSASIESSMERSQSILSSSALNWYALRITYGRELALQEYLNSEGIENFIPMHTTNIPLKTSVGFVSLFPQFIIWFLSVPRVVVSMPSKRAGAPRFLSVTLWIVNIIVPSSFLIPKCVISWLSLRIMMNPCFISNLLS